MKQNIIIIGGGIVGSTTAFYLSQSKNYHVMLIDEGIGTASRAAAGIICPWLSQRRNKAWYQLTSQGAAFYPTLMSDLQAAGLSPKELPYQQTGTFVFKKKSSLLQKLYHTAHERKESAPMIGELAILDPQDLKNYIPPLSTNQGAVLAKGGGRLDGSLLIDQLQTSFLKQGGTILKGKARITEQNSIIIGNQTIHYDTLVLSAGAWLKELLEPLGYLVDIRPQKGQLIEIQTDYETLAWPGCMLQGEIDILPFEQGKLVIGATHEDDQEFDLSFDKDKLQAMKETASAFIPDLHQLPISHQKVGIRAYASDYSPFYGRLADNDKIFVASGLGSSGLTSGPFIGWQIAQEILGLPTFFDNSLYSPQAYVQRQSSLL